LGSDKFAKAFYLPTKADLFVTELRNWVNQYSEPFPQQSLPPALSKSALLDRYNSHTISCHSCSQALKNIQNLKILVLIIGAIALSLTIFTDQNLKTVSAISLLVAGIVWLVLNNLELKFSKGQEVPLRNTK
jgi:uncharacterized protein (DUF983 family)